MVECIDSLDEAQAFSTSDTNIDYTQIDVDKTDIEKKAFTSHQELQQFIRMPFALKSPPATFQRVTDIISSIVEEQLSLVYLDVIFTAF